MDFIIKGKKVKHDGDAVMVFTSRSLEALLKAGRSEAWGADPVELAVRDYVLCTQHAHKKEPFSHPTFPHHHGFLLARITDIVLVYPKGSVHPYDGSIAQRDEYAICFREYSKLDIADLWLRGKSKRNPWTYGWLESEYGIDPHAQEWLTVPETTALLTPPQPFVVPEGKLTLPDMRALIASYYAVPVESVGLSLSI
jgi:hypothetical protein